MRVSPGGSKDSASEYFRDVSRRPILSVERERSACKRIDDGRRRCLSVIARTPTALSEVLTLGEALKRRRIRCYDVSRAFRCEQGTSPRDLTAAMLALFAKLRDQVDPREGGAPRMASDNGVQESKLRLLEALCLDARQLIRIADSVQMRAEQRCRRPDDAGRLWASAQEMRSAVREVVRARHELVEGCLRLVIYIARRHSFGGLELMDLIQEGNLGLMTAAEKFEVQRGCRFASHAHWWIVRAIRRSMVRKSRLVRLPEHVQADIAKMKRAKRCLMHGQQTEPGNRELAAVLGMSEDAVCRMKAVDSTFMLSLDQPMWRDSEQCVGDVIQAEETTTPLEHMEHRSLRHQLDEALATLQPRDQMVIRHRFGIGTDETSTLAEIGTELSLSKERVRQLQHDALSCLKKRNQNGPLHEYTRS